MKLKLYCILMLILHMNAAAHSVVLVHLGNALPTYIVDAVEQIRVFNPTCDLYLIANKAALEQPQSFIQDYNVLPIIAESLVRSKEHTEFLKKASYGPGIWLYASERFFYLYECMQQYKLSDVFHLENDNMLYADLEELLPVFKKYYKGIGAVFDNDDRCIPSFIYVAHKDALKPLAECFVAYAPKRKNDMEVLAFFKTEASNPSVIDNLPLVMKSYKKNYRLIKKDGKGTTSPDAYSKNIDHFNSIFDAAAIGQYLGGGGSVEVHGKIIPNFINESCLFDPSYFTYEWCVDQEGRRVPYVLFKGESYRINNLHIHSKLLMNFKS